MFFLRRVAFVILVICFRETLWVQLAVQTFISVGLCIYLQWYKPFESKFNNTIETFNEATAVVLTYFLFCFSDFVPEAATRSELGYYYNAVTFSNIAVHIVFMLVNDFHKIKLSFKKRCYKKKASEQIQIEAPIIEAVVKKRETSEPLYVIKEVKKEEDQMTKLEGPSKPESN